MDSSFLLSITTFAYLLCTLLYLSGVLFRYRPLLVSGSVVGGLTLVIQTAGILLRWQESYQLGYGHAPLSNLYESLVFAAWAIMLIYLILELRTKQRVLGIFPALFAFLAMAYASFSTQVDSKIQPLVPALKSNWLIAHVVACFLGYAAFAVSCGISILYLLRKRSKRQSPSQGDFRPAAGAKTARPIQLSDDCFWLSVAFSGDHYRFHLGEFRLGNVLELGPKGNMVANYLAGLCRPAACANHARLARQSGGMALDRRLWMRAFHLFWRQFPAEWPAQLRHQVRRCRRQSCRNSTRR